MPDSHPLAMGHYIGGVGEGEGISEADLIVLYGFDAVECPPGRWRYTAPVIELTRYPFDRRLVEPRVSLCGDLAAIGELTGRCRDRLGLGQRTLAWTKARLREAADLRSGADLAADGGRCRAQSGAGDRPESPSMPGRICCRCYTTGSATRRARRWCRAGWPRWASPCHAIGSCLAEPDRRWLLSPVMAA